MFAIIKTGGKQYRVSPGDLLAIEKLEVEAGDTITLNEVLMIGDETNVTVGTPTVEKAVVTAEVVKNMKAAKVIIFKKKRRHNYRRKKGHRQNLTMIRITDIALTAAAK